MIPLERRKHFLAVVTKDEAEKRWRAALRPEPLGVEDVPIAEALGRVLGADVASRIDLPPFDRAVVDGFAVVASDTFAADEEKRVRLELASSALAAGDSGQGAAVVPGKAIEVATGAPVPRGANAVVMVENCERAPARATEGSAAVPAVLIGKAVVPGDGIQLAGVDVRSGETVFRRGTRLGARETGVLAGIGCGTVPCVKRPRVAVISTGNEVVAPGAGALRLGQIYDSNARIVCDMVRENGGEAVYLGIARDEREDLVAHFERAKAYDAVVLSGGTSKGAGDLTYRLVNELGQPGILVHGVQIKPGKPIVLAAWDRKPVVVLPGFPSSAAITFDVFVKPILRILAGLDPVAARDRREATLAVSMPAGGGRHELVLTNLVETERGELVAFPIIKGSGSVAAFAQADGFFEVLPSRERVERGERVLVTLLGGERAAADLVLVGSSDPVLDALLGLLRERTGLRAKVILAGARAALDAAARGEADIAPVSAREASRSELTLVRGYSRRVGLVARDLAPLGSPPSVAKARELGWRVMNRAPQGELGALLDALLGPEAAKTPGYDTLARSHEGAVAAVARGSADFTVALESAARDAKLAFFALEDEALDFAIAKERLEKPAVKAFLELLRSEDARRLVAARAGFAPLDPGLSGPRPG